MIKLRLFVSPSCPKCPAAKALVEELQKSRDELQVEILDVSIEENYLEALMLQVSSTPTFVLEGTPIFIGTIPTLQDLNKKIDEYKQKFSQS